MPVLTQLAAAPHVRHGVHAALLEPGDLHRIELDRAAQAVRAVAREQRGIRAVELDAGLVDDRERHEHAVVARHHHFLRLEARQRVELADRDQVRVGERRRLAARGGPVVVHLSAARPRHGADEHARHVVVGRRDAARGELVRHDERLEGRLGAVRQARHLARRAHTHRDVDCVVCRHDAIDHVLTHRHRDRRGGEARRGERGAHHLEPRRVVRGHR
jgi:hypothetical protein